MKTYTVYILTNERNTVLYTGSTNDISRRMHEHKNKLADGFTKQYNVDKLVYVETTEDLYASLNRELQIKKWRREKKIALINILNPQWRDLSDAIV